jgi:hypothetical protein
MMLSNNKKKSTEISVGGILYDSTHSDNNTGRYNLSLPQNSKSKEDLYNSENLFDDSNSQDAKWLKKTKTYIAKINKF